MRGEFGERHADGFADKRNRPRRARVDLKHINNLVLHRVLHVHQAGDLQLGGHRVGVLAHRIDGRLRKLVRRHHHRRVARVHAGKLHVLEHPADDERAVLGVGDAVDIHLGGVFQKFIHEHRPLRRRLHRVLHIMAQFGIRIHNLHCAPTEHKRRPHQHGIIQLVRGSQRFLFVGSEAVGRLRDVQLVQHRGKHFAILRALDALRARAQNVYAIGLQIEREIQRRLPAELRNDAPAFFTLINVQHILERERFKKQFVARVVIRGNRFRIRIHHQRLEPILLQRERRVHAAVIELNPLPNPIRTTAENHHLLAVGRIYLVIAAIVRGIVIWCVRLELRRARIHQPIARHQPRRLALRPHFILRAPREMRNLPVRKPVSLRLRQ